MSDQRKIAFIRKGRVPLANVSTAKTLQTHFPEYKVEEIDLIPLLQRDKRLIALNAWAMLREYSADLATRRRGVKEVFLITSYIFKAMKQIVAEQLRGDDYVFTFQMQSLFDASVAGIPHFVYTDHTVLANRQYPGYTPKQLYHPNWMRLEPSIYHNARLVFTRSSHVSRSMIEDYGCDPTKIKCVYAGSNAPLNPAPAPPERYASQNIVFVGIDWERKGGPELAAAFALVRAVHPNATLTIVGANPPLTDPGVNVVGRVSLAELPQYYQNAAVFCMPTKREPFGIVIVEAMAYGLPVVTTNLGAMPDMVIPGENGALVSPNPLDVTELADALTSLIGDPERCRRFGERSRAIAARYNWDTVGQRMREEIEKVLMRAEKQA